nr:TULIP family P47-like protein [Erwinia piriflorinigrans]
MFAGWEIVAGGDAQRLNLITPLIVGKMKTSVLGKDINVAVDGLCPKLRVELAFIRGGGRIVVQDSDMTQRFSGEDTFIPILFCELMVRMLVSRRNEITSIFAKILGISAKSEASWMKLQRCQYAYNETISGELGCLAILGILESNASPPHTDELQLVFDSSLVSERGNIGFMISRHLFMKYVVLPALPEVFKGAIADRFFLSNNDVIRNNGDISLSKINGYTPYFNYFEMEIVDSRLNINNARGRCDVVLNSSYVSFNLSAAYTPQLSVVDGVCRVNLVSVTRPVFNCQGHDTVAQIFWIFGGWIVDALIQGIRSQMEHLLFEFGNGGISFDIYPINFSTASDYTECGLAGAFFMRNSLSTIQEVI